MEQDDLLADKSRGKCAIIVAHPCDETLWAGGFLAMHSCLEWYLVALWAGRETTQTRNFLSAAADFGATAILGRLYEPENGDPLASIAVEQAIMKILPTDRFEIIVTHALWGEHTYNLRSEEVGQAVQMLQRNGRLFPSRLLCFAYEGQEGLARPQADSDADIQWPLPEDIWHRKRQVLHNIYGFSKDSWQYCDAPRIEAFWNARLYEP